MNSTMFFCCSSLLLLVNYVGAKPTSDLQSLKQLLQEEIHSAPFYASEEEKDADTDKSWEERSLDSSDPRNAPLKARESILAHLFRDLMRTSKRSWSRNKKGGLRSCFGVRLERIGSFSGLGC
ncbi:natriuretic peptide A-like [Pungitius pungitius]|uniref:natriuretic peptide A-like n=1 Tax=Pungitius pungitius TaxID=134920 RepID=UPI001889A6A5|nr:natriuretic peptide A-like [Pungitius pungitius]